MTEEAKSAREIELERLLRKLVGDIDTMRLEGGHEFGDFSGEIDPGSYTVSIEWPNLAIVRDEIKEKFGI